MPDRPSAGGLRASQVPVAPWYKPIPKAIRLLLLTKTYNVCYNVSIVSPGQKRETKPKPRTHEHVSSPSDSKSNEQNKQKAKDLAQEMDEILDEIDEVLESNAEEFVKSYVQKGGQ
jgi:ubiquitin-like protein Pup